MDEQRRQTAAPLRVALTLLMGVFPVILAGWLTHPTAEGRPINGGLPRENLIFSQYSVSLGEVPPVGVIPAHFDFFNAGEQTLEIVKIEPSCGCLAPRLYDDKRVFGPNEHGRFYVSVSTANETPGPKAYSVRVHYNDGEPRERLLSFKMVIPDKKVSVTPAEVYFYQLTGEADSREIVVQDFRGRDLNVVGIDFNSQLADITVGQKVTDSQGARIPIRIDVPENLEPGRRTTLLKIFTDDPDFQRIQVPILIWGPETTIQPVKAEQTAELSEATTPPRRVESKAQRQSAGENSGTNETGQTRQ